MNRGRHWYKHEVEEMDRAEAIGRQGERVTQSVSSFQSSE